MSLPAGLENERLLELFFSQSLDGFFFMMLDEPVEWGDHVNKDVTLDFVFEHLRMTKVNSAIVTQFKASYPDELLGRTPAQFFAHDLVTAKARWREFFDRGRLHTETDERRLDGTPMRIEGDYMVIHDDQGRIAGHFGIQRDVTDRHLAGEQVRASQQELRALAARLQQVREEERTGISREIHDELGQALTGLKLDIAWMKDRLPAGSRGPWPVRVDHPADRRDHERGAAHCDRAPAQRAGSAGPRGSTRVAGSGVRRAHRNRGHHGPVRGQVHGSRRPGQLGLPDPAGVAHQRGASCAGEAGHHPPRSRRSTMLTLEVSDDGIGIPPERLDGTASLGLVGHAGAGPGLRRRVQHHRAARIRARPCC